MLDRPVIIGIAVGFAVACVAGTAVPYVFQFPPEYSLLWGVACGSVGVTGGMIVGGFYD